MKIKFKEMLVVALLIATYMLQGCQSKTNQNELVVDDSVFEQDEVIDEHNAQNSLDFLGIYKGVLPCADCEGIETIIELGSGNSYSKKIMYLGIENQTMVEISGTFTWNDAGNTVTLINEGTPNQYFVGENVLFHLDLDGNRITGDLEKNYKLIKQ
ncbi:copper resistance protein NlpE [Aquiflexum sp. TKW24L]|uniref:copper resistance protein NlpE n=1 Tax=Aquiflexum sp. TKW24L TaxID=2942212 RepID=UPI0020BEA60B|nr:copper resistance protein NlpE [Aquiflexum sp. TKW24L]MCL6259853.1 copper resistance protein NlpE [Aquiflexum sp. TKW24L]